MTKKKKKLTPERKAYKKAQKEKFEWIFIGGKKKKIRRIHTEYFDIYTEGSEFTNQLINLEISNLIQGHITEETLKYINKELRILGNPER